MSYQSDLKVEKVIHVPAVHVSSRKGTWPRSVRAALALITLLSVYVIYQSQANGLDILEFGKPFQNSAGLSKYEKQARKILSKHPLVDGHNDLAIMIAISVGNHINNDTFREPFEQGGFAGHVDLKRIDDGKYGGAFWSAFLPCPKDIFDFSDANYDPIVRTTLKQLDLLQRLSSRYPRYFPPTPDAHTAAENFHKHGKLISPLAIEGLHQVGNSFSNLRMFHTLGVRYATLTWNCHNIYADAAILTFANESTIPSTPYWGGLSRKGRVMIQEMNRLGMIVDLAHVSADTMRDALVGEHNDQFPLSQPTSDSDNKWKGSLAPPIFSHSSAHALCPHPRNVPDSVLPLVKARGSVVMVNFSPVFVACHYPPDADPATMLPITDFNNATLEAVADHIMHIAGQIGFDHVGIGTDYDGISATPKGLEAVDRLPALVAELLRRGVSEKDVIKVIGGNILRVWKEVDYVADRLRNEGALPAEDDLGDLWLYEQE